ncbi:hypothetical protein ACOMHN_012143 [Nucella lapillus]
MMSRWTGKTWQRFWRVGRVVVVVAVCVLAVSPLRNALLSPVLPGAWRPHSSLRLAAMLLDSQRFPIHTPLTHGAEGASPVALSVDLSDVSGFLEREDPYREFQAQRSLLAARAPHDPAAAEELAMIDRFRPLLSPKERAQLLFTLDVFVRACRRHALTFFLLEGSLLGWRRHQGLVPWDDDVDLALNASQWRHARRVLGNIPGFTLYASSDAQWKFYLSDLPPFHDKPFRWPNIDLFFFIERDSHVWALTWGIKNHLILRTQHLLPLTNVTWERWQLPAPACAHRLIASNYDVERCVTPVYVHKTNEEHFGFQTVAVDCSRLHKYYPFVFRHALPGGGVVESRRVGGRTLQNITVPSPPPICSQ